MLIDITGYTIVLLFLLFWFLLFYADAIIRRLTKHANVSWLFFRKVRWIRDNIDHLPDTDAEAARRAFTAIRVAGGCIVLIVLVGVIRGLAWIG